MFKQESICRFRYSAASRRSLVPTVTGSRSVWARRRTPYPRYPPKLTRRLPDSASRLGITGPSAAASDRKTASSNPVYSTEKATMVGDPGQKRRSPHRASPSVGKQQGEQFSTQGCYGSHPTPESSKIKEENLDSALQGLLHLLQQSSSVRTTQGWTSTQI